VIYRAAEKHLVGPDWTAHRRNLYAATRTNPPAEVDYELYVIL
jgi:hypothetical protein